MRSTIVNRPAVVKKNLYVKNVVLFVNTHTHTHTHSGRNKLTECHSDKNIEFNMYTVEDR